MTKSLKNDCSEQEHWAAEGNIFRIARQASHMSITAMARDLGVAWNTVKRFESGLTVKRRKFLVHAYRNALLLLWTQFLIELKDVNSDLDRS